MVDIVIARRHIDPLNIYRKLKHELTTEQKIVFLNHNCYDNNIVSEILLDVPITNDIVETVLRSPAYKAGAPYASRLDIPKLRQIVCANLPVYDVLGPELAYKVRVLESGMYDEDLFERLLENAHHDLSVDTVIGLKRRLNVLGWSVGSLFDKVNRNEREELVLRLCHEPGMQDALSKLIGSGELTPWSVKRILEDKRFPQKSLRQIFTPEAVDNLVKKICHNGMNGENAVIVNHIAPLLTSANIDSIISNFCASLLYDVAPVLLLKLSEAQIVQVLKNIGDHWMGVRVLESAPKLSPGAYKTIANISARHCEYLLNKNLWP